MDKPKSFYIRSNKVSVFWFVANFRYGNGSKRKFCTQQLPKPYNFRWVRHRLSNFLVASLDTASTSRTEKTITACVIDCSSHPRRCVPDFPRCFFCLCKPFYRHVTCKLPTTPVIYSQREREPTSFAILFFFFLLGKLKGLSSHWDGN